jgi:hypothetical protein
MLLFSVVLFCGGVLAIVLAIDIADYGYVTKGTPVAVVQFQSTSPNEISVYLKDHMGQETRRELRGDHWQLSARVLRWNRIVGLNMEPIVRLERIYGINTRRQSKAFFERSDQSLQATNIKLDAWRLLKHMTWLRKIVSLQATTTSKSKVVIGVSYTVRLTNLGLVVE